MDATEAVQRRAAVRFVPRWSSIERSCSAFRREVRIAAVAHVKIDQASLSHEPGKCPERSTGCGCGRGHPKQPAPARQHRYGGERYRDLHHRRCLRQPVMRVQRVFGQLVELFRLRFQRLRLCLDLLLLLLVALGLGLIRGPLVGPVRSPPPARRGAACCSSPGRSSIGRKPRSARNTASFLYIIASFCVDPP